MENNNIIFKIDDKDIGELIFDFKKDENIFDYNILLEFEKILKEISRNTQIKVLILRSNKENFILGYDLNEIKILDLFDSAKEFSNKVKSILNKLSNLRFTTISVINGKCLGIGVEILLSTDYRIMIEDSYLQFYENFFKLSPLGGGNILLPRIIGLENSINFLLGEKIYPQKALELKLINKILPKHSKNELAYNIALEHSNKSKYILENNHSFRDMIIEETKLGKKYLLNKFENDENKKFAEFIINSYNLPLDNALNEDSEFFAELCESKIPKNIIDFYFLEKNNFSKNNYIFKNIAIFDVNILNNSFYINIIKNNFHIRLIDKYNKISELIKNLSELIEKKYIINNISYSDDYQLSKNLDFVILSDLNTLSKIDTNSIILFNNIQNYQLKEIIENYKYPELIVTISINNNVVEIINNSSANQENINKVIYLFKTLNKKVIIGNQFFIKNILIDYLKEALSLYQENYNPNEIDLIMENFGFEKGPFKILNENYYLKEELNVNNIDYNKKDYISIENKEIIKNRLLFTILKTSIESLENNFVEKHEYIDLALVYTLNFPIHLGGIFKYIDDISIEEIIEDFKYLNKKYNNKFNIPNLLLKMNENKEFFYK